MFIRKFIPVIIFFAAFYWGMIAQGQNLHQEHHSHHGHEHLKGVVRAVTESNGREEIQTLPYASLYWAGTTQGVTSGEDGHFDLHKPHTKETLYLVVSFTGYTHDTIPIPPGKTDIEILLTQTVQLDEVIVHRRMGAVIYRQFSRPKQR